MYLKKIYSLCTQFSKYPKAPGEHKTQKKVVMQTEIFQKKLKKVTVTNVFETIGVPISQKTFLQKFFYQFFPKKNSVTKNALLEFSLKLKKKA